MAGSPTLIQSLGGKILIISVTLFSSISLTHNDLCSIYIALSLQSFLSSSSGISSTSLPPSLWHIAFQLVHSYLCKWQMSKSMRVGRQDLCQIHVWKPQSSSNNALHAANVGQIYEWISVAIIWITMTNMILLKKETLTVFMWFICVCQFIPAFQRKYLLWFIESILQTTLELGTKPRILSSSPLSFMW